MVTDFDLIHKQRARPQYHLIQHLPMNFPLSTYGWDLCFNKPQLVMRSVGDPQSTTIKVVTAWCYKRSNGSKNSMFLVLWNIHQIGLSLALRSQISDQFDPSHWSTILAYHTIKEFCPIVPIYLIRCPFFLFHIKKYTFCAGSWQFCADVRLHVCNF